MHLHPIHAGYFACDGGSLFSVIPKPMWSKVYPADENNVVKLSLRCLLVDLGEHKILIEAGVGNHYPEKVRRNNGHEETDVIEQSLASCGYRAEDITDVLFTHLHWDHCNGAVINDNGQLHLQFPHATHWCSRRQWEHSFVSNIRERAAYYPEILNFLKEEGRLQLVDEACELFPGIAVRLYDGHTPGQMIPFIDSGDKTYVYMSDLIPTSANIPIVWLASYDLYPVTAMEEKEAFLREVAEKHYILFFEHDLYTQCATVEWGDKGPRLKEKFSL
jgi:glyoxylase-like metal-dependent hydrolase (beta-lactamase superfamily II)